MIKVLLLISLHLTIDHSIGKCRPMFTFTAVFATTEGPRDASC